MAAYCISCGKKGVRWPPGENPLVFSQKCAAYSFVEYAETCPWDGAHCPVCGENADACQGDCDSEGDE